MFDFIPPDSYTPIHYNVLLLMVIVVLISSRAFVISEQRILNIFSGIAIVYIPLLIIYMGFRPISGRLFGDTKNYANLYDRFIQNPDLIIEKDYMFNQFMKWCTHFMDIHTFYIVLAILYLTPVIIFSYKHYKRYWFFAFFFFLTSFSFWAYGTNGLRNGLGTGFFILGLSFYQKKWLMYPFFLLGYFMHASILIPIAAFVASGLYKNPKVYIYIWLASIPLSLIGGSTWATFFSSLGFEQDRTAGYLTDTDQYMDQFSQTGFRWDFLLYSAAPVFAGWYFIIKKKINDVFYIHIFGTYCIANAFWILVITAAFSNRFAYLSWFLMPVVVSYPFLKYKIWNDQFKQVGWITLLYFAFTYFMNVINK